MLLGLALLAILGLWWLGRGGALPFGLTPKRLYSYAVFAVAFAFAMRGNLLVAALLALGGVWLLEGRDALTRRLGGLFAKAPATSLYRTATVEFALSIGGVPQDGTILAGPSTGQRLSQARSGDLAVLHALCREADPDGARLLEAYLDRRQPGWREHADRDRDARAGGPLQPGAMTEEEAYQVLGLQRGASLEEIRTAHRTLMKRLHPDQGGTAGQAARVNAARDRLTNRHR